MLGLPRAEGNRVEDHQLLQLHEAKSDRRLRVEAPIVFGRSPELHDYAGEADRAFGPQVLESLTRLDFVMIGGTRSVSRTHGLLDPTGPSIKDLNSYNGIYLNGHRIPPTNAQGEGPELELHDGDKITIGGLTFVVECARAGGRTFFGQLWDHRHALAAPASDPDLSAVADLLGGSRRFSTRLAADWTELDNELQRLADTTATGDGTGISVIALHLGVHAVHLSLAGVQRPASNLIKRLKAIKGSKILAIQADGDPSALEEVFADQAERDSVLLTTTLPDAAPLRTDSVEENMCSIPLNLIAAGSRRSLSAYHGLYDGIEALVPAESNLLELAWYVDYQGALTLTTGGARQRDDEEIGTSYLFEQGSAPMSNRTFTFT